MDSKLFLTLLAFSHLLMPVALVLQHRLPLNNCNSSIWALIWCKTPATIIPQPWDLYKLLYYQGPML